MQIKLLCLYLINFVWIDTNLLLDLVKNKLDITFANEQEMISLIDAKDFNDVVDFGKGLKKLLVITREKKAPSQY